MTFRRRLAVLAASSLLLAGCAVPGQDGAPGIAAEYAGVVVTNEEIDAIAAAWERDSNGTAVPGRREIATIAVLGPQLVAAADDAGVSIGEGDAKTIAQAWFEFAGVENPEVSPEVVESIRPLLAMYVLAYSDPTLATVGAIAADAESAGVFSPRVGDFSAGALAASIAEAVTTAEAAQLGNYSFTAFLGVSGFADPAASWAARG